MHLGNARTALLAWLQIRHLGGRMILRIEDIDTTRARDFAYDALRRDLDWLELDWDDEFIQSERLEIYQAQLARLDSYPCACTRKDIQAAASAPHGAEAVYPGLCRNGPVRNDRPLALRWRTPATRITVSDLRLGCQSADLPDTVGDIVLRRNDGCWAYHFAVVVDDGLMGVSHVLRGEDLWPATPIQAALQDALGFARPQYYHAPLMRDFRGERLAKRQGAPSVRDLREQGESPHRIVAELARSLGWEVPNEVSAAELLKPFGAGLSSGQPQEQSPAE
ncbi:MAG: tRNA glutamyl-Q(34) synthetase GluQRS [Candidatus Melainabacteria bacterium HGW-Melainabacteria-1]|nr:MAG: tRNA glutamyl-Q(34) synthetase GluQRS [Candidatus Melainabacteria bacterium HGW-Melainabacteria-1]